MTSEFEAIIRKLNANLDIAINAVKDIETMPDDEQLKRCSDAELYKLLSLQENYRALLSHAEHLKKRLSFTESNLEFRKELFIRLGKVPSIGGASFGW
jgi:hypothetical protein